MLTNSLDEAQKKVESYFFDIRKNLFEYDQVLNTQRERVYAERRLALLAPDLSAKMVEYAEKTVDDILEANIVPTKWVRFAAYGFSLVCAWSLRPAWGAAGRQRE